MQFGQSESVRLVRSLSARLPVRGAVRGVVTVSDQNRPLTGAELARRSQDVGLGHACPGIRSGCYWPVPKLRSLGATITGARLGWE